MSRDLARIYPQVDEVWAFLANKQKPIGPGDPNHHIGGQYVFVPLELHTKLMPASALGKLHGEAAFGVMSELFPRVPRRLQLTNHGFTADIESAQETLGIQAH
jgi:hypothetical protein